MSKPNTSTFAPAFDLLPDHSLTPCKPGSKIIVVGAGAFGGWSALQLLRKNFSVTLIDSYGPGNSRSSSGDETRVIRSTYGNNELYFDLNVRALELWKLFEQQCRRKIFFNKGVLWLCHEERSPLVDDSIPFALKHEMEYEYLDKNEIKKRYTILNQSDLHHAYLDPYGGFLKARESCQLLVEIFIQEGGEFILSHVNPGPIEKSKLKYVQLEDGTQLNADTYVFACGSWLPKIFPEILKDVITCTKQEVYYFGVPEIHTKLYESLPVWVDLDGIDFYYGIPSNGGRGFKIGVDKRGEPFDPSNDEHILNSKVLSHAREFIAHRFPGLHNAPLLENRVCPYENSPDGNFIIDNHPEAENVVIAGGGSGHGFKHGPAVGELIAESLCDDRTIPGLFSLERFTC